VSKLRMAVAGVGHLGKHWPPHSTIPRNGAWEGSPQGGASDRGLPHDMTCPRKRSQ